VDKPLKILFLTSWYPNSEDDQIGNFVRQHALAVSKNCEVHVLTTVSRSQNEDHTIDHKVVNSQFTETIVYTKASSSSITALKKLDKFRKLKKGLSAGFQHIETNYGLPDVTHLNVIFPAGLFALQLHKEYQIPFIITEHWTLFLDNSPVKIKPWQLKIMRDVVRKSSKICPVSQKLGDAMKKKGLNGDYQVVPNSVNEELFYLSSTYKREPDITKFLHVSTLDETHKNFSGMIRSFQKLNQNNPNFELTIAGEKLNKQQEELVAESGIADKINLLGVITLNEVAELMRTHDAFVLFSNYETFSIVLAEALICGIPVITTQVDGVAQEVTNELGIVVSVKDEAKLIEALTNFSNKTITFDNAAISKQFETKYSHQQVGKEFLTIYQEILQQ
jgi:glycosyltransferase involved in cell wall biosynthesis